MNNDPSSTTIKHTEAMLSFVSPAGKTDKAGKKVAARYETNPRPPVPFKSYQDYKDNRDGMFEKLVSSPQRRYNTFG
jgi:hypothetical protein